MAQGEYNYRLTVDASDALKKQAEFAKASDKTTRQVEENIKDQVKANSRYSLELSKNRRELTKVKQALVRYSNSQKDNTVKVEKAEKRFEELNDAIAEQETNLTKGRRALNEYKRDLDKLSRSSIRAKDVVSQDLSRGVPFTTRSLGPMPAPAPTRGFRGNKGIRAGLGTMAARGEGQFDTAGIARTLGAGIALRQIVETSSALEQQRLKLNVLSKEYGEYDQILKQIEANAQTFNKSQRDATQAFANVYARLRPLGFELNEIQTVFEGFNTVALASGASAEASRIAFQQLAQALGSGRLQGDEFRSIAEQIPGILVPVAQEMGVTVGELKKLGAEGKITSEVLVGALSRGFDENKHKIQELIDQSPSQQFAALGNAISDTAAEIGKTMIPVLTTLSGLFADVFQVLGQLPPEIKTLGSSLAGLGIATAALVGALKLLGIAITGAAIVALGKLALIIGAVVVPLTALAIAFQKTRKAKQDFDDAMSTGSSEELTDQIELLEGKLSKLKKRLDSAMDPRSTRALKKQMVELEEQIEQLTKRRTLIIDIVEKVHTIGGIDYKMDGPGGRLIPIIPEVEKPDPVDEAELKEQQRIADQVAKILSRNKQRLAKEEARYNEQLLKDEFDLSRRLDQESNRLAELNLTGVARAQQAIINSMAEQNAAIDAQLNTLNLAVDRAEARVKAARTALNEARTAPDIARAQGELSSAELGLGAAQDSRSAFQQAVPDLQQNIAGMGVAAMTQGFRDRAAAAREESIALQERNRFMMEGFSPEQIETQMQLADVTRQQNEALAALNPESDEYATAVDAIKTAADGARSAIEGLSKQQQQLAKTTKAFQLMSDVATSVGSAISVAFTQGFADIVTGSKTVNEVLGNLFQSIGQSFLQMAQKIIQEMITMFLLQSLLKVFGSAASAGSSAAPAAPASKYGSAGNLAGPTGDFGLGSGPSMAIPSHMQNPQLVSGFANGGLVTKPTLGLVGEGKYNEAIVPLPDGRSIPVDFRGGDDRLSKMMGKGQSGVAAPQMNFTFETTNIGGTEYVSREQLESAMAVTRKQAANDGAKRGMSMTLDKMQNSPRTRSRIGI